MKIMRFIVFMFMTILLLSSCSLLPPEPTNAQILEAVKVANEAEAEPLELVFDEMEVPHRLHGKASAVLWVSDKSIQRNFTVKYDEEEKSFYIESYITLLRGEDGVYRQYD